MKLLKYHYAKYLLVINLTAILATFLLGLYEPSIWVWGTLLVVGPLGAISMFYSLIAKIIMLPNSGTQSSVSVFLLLTPYFLLPS